MVINDSTYTNPVLHGCVSNYYRLVTSLDRTLHSISGENTNTHKRYFPAGCMPLDGLVKEGEYIFLQNSVFTQCYYYALGSSGSTVVSFFNPAVFDGNVDNKFSVFTSSRDSIYYAIFDFSHYLPWTQYTIL